MKKYTEITLTSEEITSLWTTYINDSMAVCIVVNFRKDLHTKYLRLSTAIAKCVKNGVKIMINHGWLEQSSHVISHTILNNV